MKITLQLIDFAFTFHIDGRSMQNGTIQLSSFENHSSVKYQLSETSLLLTLRTIRKVQPRLEINGEAYDAV